MGFLDGIGTLLGGFNDVKQIDQQGFDFREKRRQEELARQQQQQQWQQANEDWATKAATEADLGSPEGTDISSVIPDEVNKARVLARAKGAGLQAKSSLEDQKTYRDLQRQTLAGDQRLDQIELTGKQAIERDALKFKRDSGRELSPAEQAKLDAFERVANARIAATGGHGGTGGSGRVVYDKITANGPNGEPGTWRINRQTNEREFFPAPLPAVMRQAQGMTDTVGQNVDRMKELEQQGLTTGPILGRASKAWQKFMGPSGGEGEFDFLGNAVVDTVYAKSGKQINAEEQRVLKQMIPDRARGNLAEQIRLFDEYTQHLFAKYQTPGQGKPTGGATPPPSGGQGRMVKYKGQLVPLSSLPPELQAKVPR